MKRVRDEQGNYYMIDDNGQVMKSSPRGGFTEEDISGVKQQPTLQEMAKREAEQAAKRQLDRQVEGMIAGAGGQQVANSVAGSGAEALTGEAANAAWNAGADAATAQAAPGAFTSFGSLGFGPQAGIIAGTGMTLKGLYDLANGKKSDTPTRIVTAMSTFGGSELARALGFGDRKTTTEIQADKRKNVASLDPIYAKHVGNIGSNNVGGAASGDVAADFVGNSAKGWVNNKYANSRNLADLAPEDIWLDPEIVGSAGADYLGKSTEQQKRAYNSELLKQGLLDQEKGGFVITDKDKANQLWKDTMAGTIKPMESAYEAYKDPNASAQTPSSSRPQGPSREVVEQAKKDKKKQILSQIMPELDGAVTKAPDYAKINVGNLIRNPYL